MPGVVESMKVVTDENSERVARYAFEYGNYFVALFSQNWDWFKLDFSSIPK